MDKYRRKEEGLIPKGVDWLKTKAVTFDPDNNSVTLKDGQKIKYDYLVVSTGIYIDLDGVNAANSLIHFLLIT